MHAIHAIGTNLRNKRATQQQRQGILLSFRQKRLLQFTNQEDEKENSTKGKWVL